MAMASLQKFLRGLTRSLMVESLAGQSDRQLVERFLVERNEAVFEAIVRRHGPMVYRVCFRILQRSQDADDAFQAVFLVLAQKLRGVRKRASLASWLHGVAHRTALKARTQAAVRRRHERQAAREAVMLPDGARSGELSAVLDAELRGLPEKWRQPLVLCYLEGRTQEEAAGQLGWSKNTLRRRLEEAREALGQRLRRRGVWPAALSALLLSDCATTAAPASGLLAATVDAAAWFAAGQPVRAAVSAKVIALSQGVATAMTLTKSKWAAVLVLVLGLAGGAGMATHRSPAEPARSLAAEEQVREKRIPDHKRDLLAGNWSMALPAGFRYEVNVRRLAPDRYALEKAVRFSGVYERRRNRLVMVKPADRDEGGFEWEIAEDCLILVKQRPVEKLGSDYRGATLKRPGQAGNNGREPAAATENWNPARIEGGFMFKDAAEFRTYVRKADIIAAGILTRRGDKDGAVKVERLYRGRVKGDTLRFVYNGGLIAAKTGERVVVLLETGNGPARLHTYCGIPGLFRYSAGLATQVRIAQARSQPAESTGGADDDDTLRYYLSKSDLVVLGEFVSEPSGFSDDASSSGVIHYGVIHYAADFKISQLLKGKPLRERRVGGTIKVNIVRFGSGSEDELPELKKGGKCILFLKNDQRVFPPSGIESPVICITADMWFGVQPASPTLAAALARLAEASARAKDKKRD